MITGDSEKSWCIVQMDARDYLLTRDCFSFECQGLQLDQRAETKKKSIFMEKQSLAENDEFDCQKLQTTHIDQLKLSET